MSIDPDKVKAKIAARQAATKVAAELDFPGDYEIDCAEAFIDQLKRQLPQRAQLTLSKPPPLARLAATTLPFGKHSGKRLDEVPGEYLEWLISEQEEFYKDLRAYLTHPNREEPSDGNG